MTNCLNDAVRSALICRLQAWEEWSRREIRRTPSRFRDLLVLNRSSRERLRDVLQPWQRRDLEALDPAWMTLAGRATGPTAAIRRRAYIERPRGHSKTTDISVQILWVLLAAKQRLTGLAAAADREQARLIHAAMQRLADHNPELCRSLDFLEHLVRNSETGSQLQIISSDAPSSYGALPDFIVCDELCHWRAADLWHSLFSASAKKPNAVLTVLTNAGIGREWQWEIREHARTAPGWYFSSLNGPHAPWITDESLLEQRALLPPPVFERLWLNVWQHSDGEFVTLAEAEACRDEALHYQREGQHGVDYVAAVDYAEKHDYTVGCVCHREGLRIIVDRMDVVRPAPGVTTPVAWVNDWIEDVGSRFRQIRFVVDPHQLVQTIQQLDGRFQIERFDFHGGIGNHRLASVLHQLILQRRIAWYGGCGEVMASRLASRGGRDDLEAELASLVLRQSTSGRMRFDHRRDGVHHDDRAFTLAVAALTLCEKPQTVDFLEITGPESGGDFAWA